MRLHLNCRRNKKAYRKRNPVPGILFDILIRFTIVVAVIVTAYPVIYVLSMSVSSPVAAMSMEVRLFPVGFSLKSFELILSNPEVLQGYYNTIWYTAFGTSFSVVVTILGAYPLSRKNFFGRKFFMKAIIFTMYFSGGMVPMFILVRNLGIFNTRWAVILPSLVATTNLIICRTFFEDIPESLIESAQIDGASEFLIIYKIIVPIAKPVIAVMVLFYAVDRWNSYFGALLYLRDTKLQPIQIYLVRVLTQNAVDSSLGQMTNMGDRSSLGFQLRYSMIVLTMLPIMMVYPFLQKYFVKGVMIGALKE